MTEEEKKEWTRERFTKWVLLNNVHGIIQDLEKKFEPLYEQQKLERFLPTRQQQDVVEHMPPAVSYTHLDVYKRQDIGVTTEAQVLLELESDMSQDGIDSCYSKLALNNDYEAF